MIVDVVPIIIAGILFFIILTFVKKRQNKNYINPKIKTFGKNYKIELNDVDYLFYTGLMNSLKKHFKENPKTKKVFTDLTNVIRDGISVEEYINSSAFMNNSELKKAVANDLENVLIYLKGMLQVKENIEIRKDYNACLEVIKIVKHHYN